MSKTFKSRRQPSNPLPAAPWIYINDPSGSHKTASQLAAMIPGAFHFDASEPGANAKWEIIQKSCFQTEVMVISDNMIEEKHMPLLVLKEKSIERGSNLISIDLDPHIENAMVEPEGVHHIQLDDSDSCSTEIYQWLFTVLTVPEQLYLISDSQMQETDANSNFKEYTYCAIADARKHPKNAKIQFVALILTKPELGPDQRLHWQVMDKTGTANFYFQYRGVASQYSWDWVNSLKPGDRKCLPRMPMVKVKESTVKTIAKAPFRLTAGLIIGSGIVAKGIGRGLCKAGRKIKLGNRSEWVADIPTGPDNEFTYDAKGQKVKIHGNGTLTYQWPKVNIKVFNEKGDKVWDDDDSVVSTAASSADDDMPAGWKDGDGESKKLMLD